MKNYEDLWLGTEESFQNFVNSRIYKLEHQDSAKAAMEFHRENAVMRSSFIDDEDDYEPFFDIIEQHGEVGVINVVGDLVSEESWINALFGEISYEIIIHAVDYFLGDDSVSKIVMNFDTGGGEVGGLDTAGDVISEAKKEKPIYAHVNGSAMSAGYWLASSATAINSTAMSETGSIGVMIVHRSMKRALEERGIDITLIKAGKQKGLGHPSQELSSKDQAILQKKADTLYSFFLEHVTANRAELSTASKEVWADGKTFFAAEAKQVGLIDTIVSTTQFFQALKVDKNSAGANNSNLATNSQGNIMPKSVILSQTDKAALASGVDLAALAHQGASDDGDDEAAAAAMVAAVASATEAASTAVAEAGGDEAAVAAAVVTAVAVAEAGGDEAAVAAAVAASVVEVEDDETVAAAAAAAAATAAAAADEGGAASLLAQLGTLTTANANLTVENTRLTSELNATATSLTGLTEVAIEATHKMQIALKSEPLDMTGLPASTILAQYNRVKENFESTFKVGQQSVSAAEDQQDSTVTLPHLGIVRKAQQ